MPSQDKQASETDKLPQVQWWNQHWRQCTRPLVHWQLLWVECMAETLLLETAYLHRLACSGQRLLNSQHSKSKSEKISSHQLQENYCQALEETAAAYHERTHSIAKLSSKLRKQLWEEI